MKSCNFKSLLLRFLADEWRNQAYLDIIRGHILYLGIEDKAYRYDVHVNIVQRYGFDELVCRHEEADTRLIRHVKHICESIPDGNIIICTNDTVVGLMIILLTHAHALPTYMV